VIHRSFEGTITVSSDTARFEVSGDGDSIVMRFDQLSDLRAAWRSSAMVRHYLRPHRASFPIRVEVGRRLLAELGPRARPLWSVPGLASRLFGLPLTRLRLSGLLGR
tara:strand:- start:1490 stop:1810 length:321 start_codon:yes stop_codon:yes gene_type:complete